MIIIISLDTNAMMLFLFFQVLNVCEDYQCPVEGSFCGKVDGNFTCICKKGYTIENEKCVGKPLCLGIPNRHMTASTCTLPSNFVGLTLSLKSIVIL